MTTLPSAGPLAGRWVRLDLLGEPDLDEMYPILADPAVYAHGYVMHHRPGSLDDARGLRGEDGAVAPCAGDRVLAMLGDSRRARRLADRADGETIWPARP